MAINFIGGFENEYMSQAEAAGREAERRKQAANAGGGGSGGFIAQVFDALGINRQVAKGSKESKESDNTSSTDLANQEPEAPVTQTAVVDSKGDVLSIVEDVTKNPDTKVTRLPLAPLELSPLPRQIQSVDPNDFF